MGGPSSSLPLAKLARAPLRAPFVPAPSGLAGRFWGGSRGQPTKLRFVDVNVERVVPVSVPVFVLIHIFGCLLTYFLCEQ